MRPGAATPARPPTPAPLATPKCRERVMHQTFLTGRRREAGARAGAGRGVRTLHGMARSTTPTTDPVPGPAPGTIVTLGGGGFSMSPDGRSLLDDHLLELTGATLPRVCFVPTASGDAPDYAERFERAFAGRARTSVLSLFGRDPWGYADPAILLDQDLVYVGGGSTANLLALWRHHGLPDVLRRAAAQGTVLAGISAGMNCWFEACSTDSYGALAPLRDGLGLLRGGACPHLLGEPGRRDSLRRWVAAGELPTTWAADDHVALRWRDGALVEAVAELGGRRALRVERVGDAAVEHEIPVRLLAQSGA